ncbi:MAG: hypothetical protein R3C14_01170 [Caldilineaceae bacterium]
MNHKRLYPIFLLLMGIALLAGVLLIPAAQAAVTTPSARASLRQAWQVTSQSDGYHYQTEIWQTVNPTARLENVSRSAHTDRITLAGEVDNTAARTTLHLATANQPPLEIEIVDGLAKGRLGPDEPWQEIEFGTDLFTPGGDLMGFLDAAENVRIVDDRHLKDADHLAVAGSFPADLLPAEMSAAISPSLVPRAIA